MRWEKLFSVYKVIWIMYRVSITKIAPFLIYYLNSQIYLNKTSKISKNSQISKKYVAYFVQLYYN